MMIKNVVVSGDQLHGIPVHVAGADQQMQMPEHKDGIDHLIDQWKRNRDQSDREQTPAVFQGEDDQNCPKDCGSDVRKVGYMETLKAFENAAKDSQRKAQ